MCVISDASFLCHPLCVHACYARVCYCRSKMKMLRARPIESPMATLVTTSSC